MKRYRHGYLLVHICCIFLHSSMKYIIMSTLTMDIFYRGSCTLFSDNFICVYNTLWSHSSLNPLLSSFLSNQLWSPTSSAHHTFVSLCFGLVVWPTGFSRECETIHRHWNVTPQWLYHWRQCQWLSLPQQLFTVIGSRGWDGASLRLLPSFIWLLCVWSYTDPMPEAPVVWTHEFHHHITVIWQHLVAYRGDISMSTLVEQDDQSCNPFRMPICYIKKAQPSLFYRY